MDATGGGHFDDDDFDVFDGDRDDDGDDDSFGASAAKRRRRAKESSSSRGHLEDDGEDGDEDGDEGRGTAEEFARWEQERKKSGKGGGAIADDDNVASMMERLTQEAELGTFRALPPKYAARAAAWHRKLAEGRVSQCNTVLLAVAKADGKSAAATEEELHLRDAKGAVLATGYRRTVGDEHGYYIEFGLAQLNPEMKLQKQMRTKLSEEYAWTRFKAPGGVDVYYAGDDPFLQKQQQPPPPPAADVVVNKTIPPAPKTAAVTEIPNKRQFTMEKFFGGAKPTAEGGGQKRPRVTATKSPAKRKHSRFGRNVFYVRALDIVGVSKV